MHSSPATSLPHTLPKKSIREQQIAPSNHTVHRLAITSSPNSNHGSYWWTTCEKVTFWYLKSVVCKTLTVSLGWWDLSYWRRSCRNYWIWNGPYKSKCLFFSTFNIICLCCRLYSSFIYLTLYFNERHLVFGLQNGIFSPRLFLPDIS